MKQFVVDAFADKIFSGNPAAVCVMDGWLGDELMLKIARENNLSETAFAVPDGAGYRLRWFTPGGEIELCGHATLATAFVLMNYYGQGEQVRFATLGGDLTVTKVGEMYEMDFPAYELQAVPVTDEMAAVLGARPAAAYMGRDLLCVFDDEAQIRDFEPDLAKICELPGLLLQITAPGSESDCVSRTFAPKLDVSEDPVCGSGHCHIVPYWAARLGKDEIHAYQASARGGELFCRMCDGRVKLAGKAALYAIAEILVENA